MSPNPIHDLPADYHEAEHAVVTENSRLLRLNLLALIPMALSLVLIFGWMILMIRLHPPAPGPDIPWIVGVIVVLLIVVVVHEWLHGLAIQWVGHRVRYGFKLSAGVPYATSDNALFRRNEFIFVALAPLIGITLLGMALMAVAPSSLMIYVIALVVLNGGGAIGDLWMVGVVRRYPATALVRDEADGIRVYVTA
jgi:putative zincin peptidase